MQASTTVRSMKLLFRAGVNAVIVWLTFTYVDGLSFGDDWVGLVLVVVMLAFANAFVRPILKLLALPARIATLGLFTLVINIAIVFAVLWLAEKFDLGLSSDGWQPALIGAVVISILTSIVSTIVKD